LLQPPLLLDQPLLTAGLALALAAALASPPLLSLPPLEGWLESQRVATREVWQTALGRPDFAWPVTLEKTELLYTAWSPLQKVDLYGFEDNDVLLGTLLCVRT
jgi:hypothetical protein